MRREEVLRRIEGVLESSREVSGGAYFGSVAMGTNDSYSDIDLVVRCPNSSADPVVARLHEALRVVLFRPFTAVRRPSGRYWFEGVSPFLRLDVSFHEDAVFDELLVRGHGFAQPPFEALSLQGTAASTARELPRWTEMEFEFGGALRNLHETLKCLARGVAPKRPLAEVEAKVESFEAAGLRPEVWGLYRRTAELVRGST
jgi:predicted nucleotidyltransferase